MLFGTYTAVNKLHTGVNWLTRESVGDQPRNELKDAQLSKETHNAKHQGEIDDEPLVSGNSPVKERNAVPEVLQTLATALVRVAHRHEGATSAASTATTTRVALRVAAGQISETSHVAHIFINLVEN